MNQEGGREGRRGQTTSFLPQREGGARGSRREGTRLAIPPLARPRLLSFRPICSCLSLYFSLLHYSQNASSPLLSRKCRDHVTATTSYVHVRPSKRIAHVPVCLCSILAIRKTESNWPLHCSTRVGGQGGARPSPIPNDYAGEHQPKSKD